MPTLEEDFRKHSPRIEFILFDMDENEFNVVSRRATPHTFQLVENLKHELNTGIRTINDDYEELKTFLGMPEAPDKIKFGEDNEEIIREQIDDRDIAMANLSFNYMIAMCRMMIDSKKSNLSKENADLIAQDWNQEFWQFQSLDVIKDSVERFLGIHNLGTK